MNPYHSFIFTSYAFHRKTGKIELNYSLDDDITFTETITLQSPYGIPSDASLFMLHLIGGISYYKTCLPKTIEIRSGTLNEKQAKFWNTVYESGLGEFFFKNKIDFRGLINFPFDNKLSRKETPFRDVSTGATKILVPIGGGKDSIVTIELLKKINLPITLLRVGHHPFINQLASIAKLPLLTIERSLSGNLFDLNAQGALNGHVPITAYLSILSIVLSEAYGFSHVVFSNERSADEGNVELHGKQINHQWSKSVAFEKALREYIKTSATSNVEYFSLLRPFSELSIVQMFAQYPQYFPHFTSCNSNWKILKIPNQQHPSPGAASPRAGRWCGRCPKCAFAFAMLSAFLSKDDVLTIFEGNNLFADDALLPTYRELLGLEGIKPFECVGTPEETYSALMLADDKEGWEGTAVMTMLEKEALHVFPDAEKTLNEVLMPSGEHCIPETFRPILPLT